MFLFVKYINEKVCTRTNPLGPSGLRLKIIMQGSFFYVSKWDNQDSFNVVSIIDWNFKWQLNDRLKNCVCDFKWPEMEFKEFKARFKSAKTRFKLSAVLNLDSLNIWYNFKGNQPYLNRGLNLNRRSNSLNSATGALTHLFCKFYENWF